MPRKSKADPRKTAGILMTKEEELEEGIIESMDASDPPSAARKGDDGHPVPSSGYRKEDWEQDDGDGDEEENG